MVRLSFSKQDVAWGSKIVFSTTRKINKWILQIKFPGLEKGFRYANDIGIYAWEHIKITEETGNGYYTILYPEVLLMKLTGENRLDNIGHVTTVDQLEKLSSEKFSTYVPIEIDEKFMPPDGEKYCVVIQIRKFENTVVSKDGKIMERALIPDIREITLWSAQ